MQEWLILKIFKNLKPSWITVDMETTVKALLFFFMLELGKYTHKENAYLCTFPNISCNM